MNNDVAFDKSDKNNGKNPFFSVIIPTLNEELFLPKILESLAKQTLKDFEVIIIDGKSNDKTVQITKSYTQKLPKLRIFTSEKRNVSVQRNIGAKSSSGTYLVFLDADVQAPKNFLSAVYKILEKKKKVFLTTWVKADTHNARDNMMTSIANIEMEAAKMIERQFAGGWCTIIYAPVFSYIGGFDETIVHGEDFDLSTRLYEAGIKLTTLKEPRLHLSFRRFRQYGYFAVAGKLIHSSIYGILKKPTKKALFEYPMGGEIYKNNEEMPMKRVEVFEDTLLRKIKQLLTM